MEDTCNDKCISLWHYHDFEVRDIQHDAFQSNLAPQLPALTSLIYTSCYLSITAVHNDSPEC